VLELESTESTQVDLTQEIHEDIKKNLFKGWVGLRNDGTSFLFGKETIQEIYQEPPEEIRSKTTKEALIWLLCNCIYAKELGDFNFDTLKEME